MNRYAKIGMDKQQIEGAYLTTTMSPDYVIVKKNSLLLQIDVSLYKTLGRANDLILGTFPIGVNPLQLYPLTNCFNHFSIDSNFTL